VDQVAPHYTATAGGNAPGPIGAMIRALRRQLGLTQAELAARVGRSPSYISALESGATTPSLTTLRHIATALDTVVAAFFEEPAPDQDPSEPALSRDHLRPRVVRPATRKVLIDPARGHIRWELLTPDLQRQLEVVHMSLVPGAVVGEEEWITHSGEECGVVLAGTLDVEFETERFTLMADDSICFASTLPHRIVNRSPEEARAIWIITPPTF
jgi:transcriptional regulator with XRE-family HTH domain